MATSPEITADRPNPTSQVAFAALMAIGSMTLVQLGAALAKPTLDSFGPLGTTWLRLAWAALLLAAITRPRILSYSRAQWRGAVLLGAAMAGMTLCYFQAVIRIPLGLATAIEFLGPLGVAAFGMRRAWHAVWPVLALVGVVLLVHDGSAWTVDPVGAGFALAAGLGWAIYILLMKRVGQAFEGLQGLTMSLAVAALVATPWGLAENGGHIPLSVLGITIGLAILVPLLPYALEMMALRRMPTRAFGILMSAEPALGTLIGFVVLGQALSPAQLAGIALVVIASLGAVAGE
ncbi:inner membrane transporter RhtA [Inquilinus ginsengisoli]|uniref:Inner membrane transporter RhtA n=1 Tax=Inquilinus ginsengisoli TaxID=363840 RepID=A0ABU1JP76_9PROT|nr:EamA family transporter [Inquilinus ginsengisoli]MDR6289350.1 inner membrane transporter RhtA [Inquilinus ginsengisoli]